MLDDNTPADHQHPAASFVVDQQGSALSRASTKTAAYTGDTVIASESIGTAGSSPPPALCPLPRTELVPLAGRIGPSGIRCNRCHCGHTLQCAEHEKSFSKDECFDCIRDPALFRYEERQAPETNLSNVKRLSFSWWQFPAEVRNMIYNFSLHWPNSYALYRGYNKQLDRYYRGLRLGELRAFPQFTGRLRAPTILLLCKVIKNECIHILQSRPFVIDQIPPWLPGALQPMKVLDFVGRQTLRSLRYIDIRIALGEGIGSGWVWKEILREIFDVLHNENRLLEMRIMLKCCNISNTSLWDLEERNKYLQIKGMITSFRKTPPNVWTPGKVSVEDWVVEGHRARRVEPWIPEEEQETYYYPNREIWPGSMLEFVQPIDPVQRRISSGNHDTDSHVDRKRSGDHGIECA